jgi:hypothetical protein
MQDWIARRILVTSLGFVALTAVGGGLALATRAEAERFPNGLLVGTPFRSYLIPGLILTFVVGGSAVVALVGLARRLPFGARVSVAAGGILMGWIIGEVLLLPPSARSWLEAFYFALGLIVVVLARSVGSVARTRGPCPEGAASQAAARPR